MLGRILLAVILIPLIELALLSQLMDRMGILTTITVVVVTGIVGISLAKQQGLEIWNKIQRQMASGQPPSQEILHGLMILFAGALLLTPGLLTDCVGFSLLVPSVRRPLGRYLTKWFMSRTVGQMKTRVWSSDVGGLNPDEEPPTVRVIDPGEDRIDVP